MDGHEATIAERVARNQATFRDANERLEAAAEDLVAGGDPNARGRTAPRWRA